MKTKKIVIVILISFNAFLQSNGGILVVDNHFPTPAGAYATIQLAHNAASAGDTIILTPSEAEYAGITVTKTVHIIGNGWERPSNLLPNTKTGIFYFQTGSNGSSLTGCLVNGQINIYTDDITIKRNKCNFIYSDGNLNTTIIQNVLISGRSSTSYEDAQSIIYIASNSSVTLANNVIINTAQNLYTKGIVILYPSSCNASNNILKVYGTAINFYTSGNSYISQNIQNNIILQGSIGGIIGSFNNIGSSTQFPATDGNKQNIDINSLFVDLANNDFHLKSGSPAIGAGYNGTDCGIYGGELGFVDKGVPSLPYIYFLDVPAVANKRDGLNVTVKAKSGN